MSTHCTTPLGNETLNLRVIKALFLGIIFVVALLLNVKTFLVLLKRKRQHRNVVTLFLLNLTLVSALMVSQVPFNIHAIIEQGWIFGDAFCQFNGFSNVFLCMDQIFTLLCLTIDRYLAVVKPLRHRSLMTRRTAYHMLVVVYFLSLLLAVIPILGKARYKYHPGTNHCSPAWSSSCGYAAVMTTVAFIVPIVGMLITYTRIFLTLRNKRVLMNKSYTPTMSSKGVPVHDMDSNSLGNFEDTSTDPSGDSDIRLTVHKTMVDSKKGILEYDLQPGSSSKRFVKTDSTIKRTTGKLAAGLSSEHSTRKDIKDIGLSAYKTVENPNKSCVEHALETCSSDEQHLEDESTEKHTKWIEKVNAELGESMTGVKRAPLKNKSVSNMDDASKTRITYIDVIGRDVKATSMEDHETAEEDVAHTRLSDLSMEGLPGKVTSGRPTTSMDQESSVFDTEEIHIAENKQVSFQNSPKVSPSKTKIKEQAAKRRLSGIFVVTRMKKQRAIRHEYKIARTGTMLVLSFLILWMPYVIAHSCFLGNCRTMTFYNIATFLVYTNALANPIIYALTNRAVMQDIRKSMGRLCRSM